MRSLLVAGLALVPALAAAETNTAASNGAVTRPVKAPGTAQLYDVVAGAPDINGLQFARQVLPPSNPNGGTTQAVALSKTIYLNKNGVTLAPGNNDSRTNKSTLASQTTSIPAWNVSATTWTAVVACMKDEFARFDVNVTDVDPGAGTQHIEAVFGGSPGLLGMPNGVAGVSPFTNDCSIIENSIVFTFTNVIPQDARTACEIMAQEVAHSYGLDHELLASDPMTYLDYNGARSFQNMTASCGEDTARPCGINGNTCRANQNSVTLLTDRIGLKAQNGDTTPPTGSITSPSANATVPPGFSVYASAADNVAVTASNLYVDGTMVDMKSGAGPYTFTTSSTLSEGLHKLKVEVTDGANTIQTTEITVTVKKGATPPSPTGTGNGDTGGDNSDAITGGCAAGGSGGSLLLGLALVGLVRRRRN